jgi:hypothetical protein
MKKLLVLTSALLVLSASIATAQINLAWRNCITVVSGVLPQANFNYACDASFPAPFRGVLSFAAPTNLAQFVGMQAVIDIQTDQPVLPEYWRMGLGECRDQSFSFPVSLSGIGNTTTCRNPWAGGGLGGGYQYNSGVSNQARARVQFAFARDTDVPLVEGQQYVAGMFSIDTNRDLDIGDGECAGCLAPACLVLNEMQLLQVGGQTPPQQDIYVLTTPGISNWVTWQGGAVPGGGCPGSTPTKNSTWGSVKALYR